MLFLPHFRAGGRRPAGFTLPEILIVVAILAAIASFSAPATVQFLRSRQLDAMTNQIVVHLREARWNAMQGKVDGLNGIKFFSQNYVRFAGVSYAARNQALDETFPLEGTSVNGADEIVFAPVSGAPLSVGTFSVANAAGSITVEINGQGLISIGAKTLQSF